MDSSEGSLPLAEAIWNGAFYRFAPVPEPARLRREILGALDSLEVRGTFLLAKEGVNGSLAGRPDQYKKAWENLSEIPLFRGIPIKWSEHQGSLPFKKLVVKVKKEIVTFRQGESWGSCSFQPSSAPHLKASDLKSWLDQKRDVLLLDTRNAFEFRLGSFENAVHFEIPRFVDLPAASKELKQLARGRPIVSFCTGGIRCEKAAPFLAEREALPIFQLEGGILEYFAKVGGAHWRGECFVFDQRVALSPDLKPTGARLCRHCQEPVPKGKSCPSHPEFVV